MPVTENFLRQHHRGAASTRLLCATRTDREQAGSVTTTTRRPIPRLFRKKSIPTALHTPYSTDIILRFFPIPQNEVTPHYSSVEEVNEGVSVVLYG